MGKKNKDNTKFTGFPSSILQPVGNFLNDQLKLLKSRKKTISRDDPFKNVSRISDNAAPDADAEEQFGHARVVAVKSQIDRKIIQTRKALSRIRIGQYGYCEECGEMIDTERLMVYPEATRCVKCEAKNSK